jgi:hypothetical protein
MMQLKDNMSNIEKIRQEIERLKNIAENNNASEYLRGQARVCRVLLDFIDSMPDDASCVYDTNKLTPTPSVNIEDVARVQFASHAHVFDRKRKAVFDWEQFKEVAGIFYGFGKKDSLPEEKPSEDLEAAAEKYADGEMMSGLAERAFIAGGEWQREQMMEKAVEGEIGYWNQRGLSIRIDKSLERLGYDMDTKVKIIIVKQDE